MRAAQHTANEERESMTADHWIDELLRREGWPKYTDLAADRGGPTKGGITLAAWREYTRNPTASAADVEAITEPQAREFYRLRYVLPFAGVRDALLAELLIDCGVNHGVRHAAKWVQWAAEVKQDGVLGPVSLAAINAAAPLELVLWVNAFRIRLYGRLVSRDHSQAVFAAGWNNRAAEFLESAARQIEAAHRATG
jgi:lysozyme family protein